MTEVQLTSSDPEPPIGSQVTDDLGRRWYREVEGYWLQVEHLDWDPESWVKVAGNYGPVTLVGE